MIKPINITNGYVEFSVSGMDTKRLGKAEDWMVDFVKNENINYNSIEGNNDVPYLRFYFTKIIDDENVLESLREKYV